MSRISMARHQALVDSLSYSQYVLMGRQDMLVTGSLGTLALIGLAPVLCGGVTVALLLSRYSLAVAKGFERYEVGNKRLVIDNRCMGQEHL